MQTAKHHGSLFLKLLIFGFSFAVGVLAFWLLGYMLRDIDRIDGPNYANMLEVGIPPALNAELEQTTTQITELNRQIESAQQQRRLTGQTTADPQQIMEIDGRAVFGPPANGLAEVMAASFTVDAIWALDQTNGSPSD